MASTWQRSGRPTDSDGATYDLVSERTGDRLGLTLRPIPNRRFAYALVVALAAPAFITGLGYVVSYPRIAIPVLLYLLAMIGAVIGQFVAWIGALINTSQLQDKTWFVVLLVCGLLSFGFVAMVIYLVAGPPDPRPRAVMPPTLSWAAEREHMPVA